MMADLIVAIILCVIYLKWFPGWARIKNFPRTLIVVPILALFCVGLPVIGFHRFMVFLTSVPITSDCQLSPDTVAMPSGAVLYTLWLPPNPGVGSGLAKLTGPIGSETKVAMGRNIFVYKCDVVNHGSTPIFNVEMAVHLRFMEVVDGMANESDKALFVREWSISMPEIGVGKDEKFSFYISNNSKQLVLVTLPATVSYKRSNGNISVTELTLPQGLQMNFPPSL